MSGKSYKWRGGWGMVDFAGKFGIVRKDHGHGTVQSMRDRDDYDSFNDAKQTADMLNMGSDQCTHVAVQRAFLRKK